MSLNDPNLLARFRPQPPSVRRLPEPPPKATDYSWVDTWAEKWAAWPDGTKSSDEFRAIARAHVAQKDEIAKLKAELAARSGL